MPVRVVIPGALLALMAAGCAGEGDAAADAGANVHDSAPGTDADPIVTASVLGMNDVSMLVPLPSAIDTPVVARAHEKSVRGDALVPQGLFDRLVSERGDPPIITMTLDQFHVVAVRFDLCDRTEPGECEAGRDAVLRIVYQPIDEGFGARDVALHGFYAIPDTATGDVIARLLHLAEIQREPTTSALQVSPALERNPSGAYAEGLRDMLMEYAGAGRLVRLTLFAQPVTSAAINWDFGGVEKKGDQFETMMMVGLDDITQRVVLVANDSFEVTPIGVVPSAISAALTKEAFSAASVEERVRALESLAEVDDPLFHSPNTAQCFTCHLSTLISSRRADEAGINLADIGGRYETPFDVSVDAGDAQSARLLRAFGWFGETPLISRRVAHETAQVLMELDKRRGRSGL